MMFTDLNAIRELESQVMQILLNENNLNEESTKQRIIEPILTILGWHIFGNELQREYNIDRGQRQEKADYVASIDHIPRLIIEAKALNEKLKESHARQVIGYGKFSDIRWCILTNGKNWNIYDAKGGREPKDCIVLEIEIQEGILPSNALKSISRDSVINGKLDKTAGESRFSSKLETNLSRIMQELRDETIKKAANRIYNRMKKDFPEITRNELKKNVASFLRINIASEKEPVFPMPPPEPSEYSIDYHFENKYSYGRPIFDELQKSIQKTLEGIRISSAKYYIAFRKKNIFAVVHSYQDHIDVLLRLPLGKKGSRINWGKDSGKNWGWSWVNTRLILNDKEDVDDELIDLIKESYALRRNL